MTKPNLVIRLQQFLLAICTAAIVAMPGQSAHAYGLETHFYETETMLLYAGIHPAIAERIAAYAQWVDTSKMNSAMNPIPGVHARVSRLMHFPTEGASLMEVIFKKVAEKLKIKVAHGDIKNFVNVAVRDSMIANEIFNEALKTGNPFLMGAALHVLMDSYAHEGFNFIVGHGDRGHYPDRPWMFVPKHNEMRKKVFLAMTRIRAVLPANGLSDYRVNEQGKLNREMFATELYESYSNNPIIKEIDTSIPHRDPLYTGEAVNLILDRMIEEGTAKPELKSYLFNDLRGLFFDKLENGQRRDGWEIMRDVVEHLYSLDPSQMDRFLDADKVMEVYGNVSKELVLKGTKGRTVTVKAEDVLNHVSYTDVIENMLRELCSKVIPRPALGDDDSQSGAKQSFENEHLYQNPEAKVQMTKWQMARQKLFGLTPHILDQTTVLTRLFLFLRKDANNLLADLDKMEANIQKVQVTRRERTRFMFSLFKYIVWDYVTYRVTYPLHKMKLLDKPMGNLRLTDENVPGAKLWQMDDYFNELRQVDFFKQIYSERQVDALIKRWEKHNAKFAQKLKKMNTEELSPDEKLSRRRDTFFDRYGGNATASVSAAIRSCVNIHSLK